MKKISRILYTLNIPFYLSLNKWGLLFYLNLVIYGFYGSLIPKNLTVFILITLIVALTQTLFGYLYINKNKSIHFKFIIDFKILLTILFFIVSLSFFYLNNPLIGDELSYTQSAIRHGIVISEYLAIKFSILNNYKFINLIFFINLLLLCFFILLILIFNVLKKHYKIIFSLFILLIFRFIIFKIGGNNSPHPPLNHLSTLFFSLFIPENYIIIRLSYIIPFAIFCYFLFNLLNIHFNKINSFLLIIFYATLPILFFLSHTIEQSLWSTFIFTYILVYLYVKNEYNYSFIIFLLSIFTLFRLPSILYFIPILFFYFYNKNYKIKINFIPILICIPFFIYFTIAGTASFDTISNHSNLLDRYKLAITSGIIVDSFLKYIPLYFILFIIFIPNTKNKLFNIIMAVTFFFTHILFYSINPNTWGFEKYQSEIYIPFIFLGSIILFKKFNSNYYYLSFLIFCNLYYIKFSKTDISSNINKYYAYDSAYTFIKNIRAEDSTYSLGLTYGILPEILNGYTVSNVIKVKKKYKLFENFLQPSLNENNITPFLNILRSDQDINYLIIGYTADKKNIINKLLSNHWKIKKLYTSNNQYQNVYIFSKF